MTHQIAHAKDVCKKAKQHEVSWTGPFTYQVTSATSNRIYWVALSPNRTGGTCSCAWGKYRPWDDLRSACSHVQAVIEFVEEQNARGISAWNDQEQAARQHRPIINLGDGVVVTSRKEGS